jgi:RES domain-containing protein
MGNCVYEGLPALDIPNAALSAYQLLCELVLALTLQRAILTRSDLSRADIYGADFTNALVDKTQQMAMCKYADGVRAPFCCLPAVPL